MDFAVGFWVHYEGTPTPTGATGVCGETMKNDDCNALVVRAQVARDASSAD